jgi:hypothetical protein
MKKNYVLFLLLWAYALQAQERLQNTLLFGKADASKILRAYAQPGFEAAGIALAEGWHASARPLHSGKFNFQLAILGGFSNNTTLDLRNLGLQVGQVKPDKPTTATLMGTSGGVLLLPNSRGGTQELNLLNGSSLPAIPIMALQFNFGLFRNTELNFRSGVIPIEENLILLGGFGFKHELKQWFPAIALANFDVSIFGNVSAMFLTYNLTIDNLPNNPNDQTWKAQIGTAALGGIVSKRFAFLTLTAGLQRLQSIGDMSLEGTYLVGNAPNDPAPMRNPVSESFSSNSWSFILGTRLSLGFLSIQLTGNLGKNSSAGVSFILGRVQRR